MRALHSWLRVCDKACDTVDGTFPLELRRSALCLIHEAPGGGAGGNREGEGGSRSSKRSTERGEDRTKLIAALTKHHQYADGGCLNLEPIGNNALAKAAGVSVSTASIFFNDAFHGHARYKAICRDAGKLVAALKLLNGELAPFHLLGEASADLAASDE